MKVLVIDDSSSMRGIVREALENGFTDIHVDEASDGRKAQELLRTEEYDMVLCDWMMPDVDGGQLLQWMRSTSALSSIPFIMITSKSDKQSILEALKTGATDYIVKPFTSEGLVEKVCRIITK